MSMRRPIVGVTVGTPIGPDSLLNKLNISQAIEDYLKNNPPASGEDGADGYSPTVSVSEIDGGYRITIIDVNGTETVDILHGIDGEKGDPGDPYELTEDDIKRIIDEIPGGVAGGSNVVDF